MERFIIVARRYLFTHGSGEGFVRLFISKRLIHGAAAALLGVFVPIFLYTTSGENFILVGGFFAITSLCYVTLLVPGVQMMNRYGMHLALVVAGVFNTLYFGLLYYINEENIFLLILPLAGALTLFRIFHWVPYHVDFAIFTKDGERGRDVSLTYATIAFLGVIGPILAGYIISNSGYETLFAISVVLLVAATVSYSFVPKTNETFTWTYRGTWRRFFSKEYRPLTLGMFANGAETAVTLVAWPVFLFEVLNGNVLEIGAVSTFVVGATILVQLGLGRYLDRKKDNQRQTLRVGSTLYAVGWIIKIFVLSATQIFFVGLYHNITKIFTKTPFDAIFYDMSADQGHYVDELTVLREMATHLGRFAALVLIVILTLFVSIQWTFILGAIAALMLNMLYKAVND